MTRAGPERHQLEGFPKSVMMFVRAMEGNRRKVASDFGLTEIEIRALFRIAEAGNITPKELASDLLVTTGAVTGVSDRLIASGLVTRIAHPDDRRSLFLELTTSGHAAMRTMHTNFIAMLVDAAQGLDAADVASTTNTLRSLTGRLEPQPDEEVPGP
jgi:MarR family 2-MHQ and catechol resistance regulon transcriptional repressor